MRNAAGMVAQGQFSRISGPKIERSVFDRSSGCKTAFDAGYLIPFFVDEVLPGDTMRLKTGYVARLSTPIFPYMDNVYLDFHYFFVPNRLVWSKWEKFCGAQDNPGDTIAYTVPQLDDGTHAAGFSENSLYDYLGLPTKIANVTQADMPNALIPRSYYKIWNDWYRDENLQNSLTIDTGDGPDTTAYALKKRGRRKDYFFSALTAPQKGTAVSLPLGTSAPVVKVTGLNTPGLIRLKSNDATASGAPDNLQVDATGHLEDAGAELYYDPNGTLIADLSTATAATINALRAAEAVQKFLERDARGGTRYVELLLAHWGVVVPDFRLQRSEYLGGGSGRINVNPIAQTSPSSGSNAQGDLAAYAVGNGISGFNHTFVEHGHVIGLVSCRADQTYQNGLDRMWSRQTRYDFHWPEFSHLGEQAILFKEMKLTGNTATDNGVWGYAERSAEYKYKPSRVTAQFRSNHSAPLHQWHLALDFSSTTPSLTGNIEEDPPIDRIIAVSSEPHIILDTYTQIKHARAIPVYSVPGLTDRF